MRFFIYARKSVIAKRGESIQHQINWAKKYIQAHFAEDTPHQIAVYQDEGFSGKTIDRPDFQRMLADMRKEKPHYLLCYRLDRISRSVRDFSVLIEALEKRHIGFICQQGNLNTQDHMGKAVLLLSSVFAQLERETIAERVRDNMLSLAESGRWLGGNAPLGYRAEKTTHISHDGKQKTIGYLRSCEEELMIVKTMYRLYAQKGSIRAVVCYCNTHFPSRSGKPYTASTVRDILRNPIYAIADNSSYTYFIKAKACVCIDRKALDGHSGLLVYNKRNYRNAHGIRNPINEWIIAIGHHDGIIKGSRWVRIQRLLQSHTTKTPRRHAPYALISGRIRCGQCGQQLLASKRHNDTQQFDYICKQKLHGGKACCTMQNLHGRKTDAIIWQHIETQLNFHASVLPLLKELQTRLQQQEDGAIWQRQIMNDQKKIDQLLTILTRDDVSETLLQQIQQKIDTLTTRIHACKKQLAKYKKDMQDATEKLCFTTLMQKLAAFHRCAREFAFSDKQRLASMLIKDIAWDGKQLTLWLYEQ